MEYIAEKVVETYEIEFSDSKEKELQLRLERIEKEFDKCFNTIMSSSNASIISRAEEKAAALEQQKSELETDIAKIRIASGVKLTKEIIMSWMKSFCKGDPMDEKFRCRIIDTFINSVYVYDDKLVVYYNVKDCKQVSYIENTENLENLDNEQAQGCLTTNHTALPQRTA